MQTSARVEYGLFDRTAATEGVLAASEQQSFVEIYELHDYDQKIRKWMTLEGDGCLLDGTFELLPDDISGQFMGLWSQALSNADGVFDMPVVLGVTFGNPHTSAGITLIFSEATEDYCTDLTIEWIGQDGAMLSSKSFTPDSAKFFCENQVEDYYGLNFTFRSTNRPYHFLKLTGVMYGVLLDISGERLISCSITEDVDPTGAELPVNTMTFKFHSADGVFNLLDPAGAYVLFQQRQQITAYENVDGNEMLMGSFYLDEPESESKNTTSMSCIDLIGVIDDTDYMGGYWPDGITVEELIADIMQSAGVDDYAIDGDIAARIVKGYLAICTHREALQQVAFAVGAVADCSRSKKIEVSKPKTASDSYVSIGRKIDDHTPKQLSLVTGVEVYVHTYRLSSDTTEVFNGTLSTGTATVTFSQPTENLSCSGATIIDSGVNYAILQVATAGTVTVSGKSYEDQTMLGGSVYASNLPANAKNNIAKVTECTLAWDAQATAQRLYDYYQMRYEDTGKILLSNEKAGGFVTIQNQNNKSIAGNIESMEIDLTGGFIAKVVTRGAAVSV